MNTHTDPILETMVAHVERHVGRIANVVHPPGPDLVHVDVLHVRPTRRRPWHTLVTCGMSRRPMCPPEEAAECRLAELFFCLPPQWPVRMPDADLARVWPFIELAALARLPHLSESWLWYGHTVGAEDPLAPIAPGVGFTAWILGPHLSLGHEGCEVRFGAETIWLLSVLPIYPEELDLARRRGAGALFRRLEAGLVTDVIDVGRRNCVTQLRLGTRAAPWPPEG